MSRSYKRHPIVKDNRYSAHHAKQLAARRFRRKFRDDESEIPRNRSIYKKINRDSWDIHDYISRWSEEQAIADYEQEKPNGYWHKRFETLEDFLSWYHKEMLGK